MSIATNITQRAASIALNAAQRGHLAVYREQAREHAEITNESATERARIALDWYIGNPSPANRTAMHDAADSAARVCLAATMVLSCAGSTGNLQSLYHARVTLIETSYIADIITDEQYRKSLRLAKQTFDLYFAPEVW